MRQGHRLALDTEGAAPSAVVGWNRVARQAVRAAGFTPAAAARTLAALHACLYNAWAAYDDDARQTARGVAVRLPRAERGAAGKAGAMHHAAHALLGGVVPAWRARFDAHLRMLGLDPRRAATPLSPAGIGRAQAAAMLDALRAAADADADADVDDDADTGEHAAAGAATVSASAQVQGEAAGQPGRWFDLAEAIAARARHDDDQDVLLFFVLTEALADGGAAAAAEVLRRFTGSAGLESGSGVPAALSTAAGRDAGARVFARARRCWMGR